MKKYSRLRPLSFSSLCFAFLLIAGSSGCSKESGNSMLPIFPGDAPGQATLTGMTVTGSGTTATINWTDTLVGDLSSVKVSWTDGTNKDSGKVAPGAGTYTITELTANTEYNISVTSMGRFGLNKSEAVTFSVITFKADRTYYFIYTDADLNAVRGGVAGYADWDLTDSYILMADLDLSGYSTDEGWIPLGDSTTKFTGIFNGNNHTISNLTINRSADYQGLFGYVSSTASPVVAAGIYHLALRDINVTGAQYTGGIAGYTYCSTIKYCSVAGTVTGTTNTGGITGFGEYYAIVSSCNSSGTINGTTNTGGIAGKSYNGMGVGSSYSTAAVNGVQCTGGLVGYISEMTSSIGSSHASGDVTGTDQYTGGIVGYAANSPLSTSYYETGTVQGTARVGGVAGYAGAVTITSCQAGGTVTGSLGTTGGIAGETYNVIITGSSSTAAVTGKSDVGGLVGYYWRGSSETFQNCTTSGTVTGTGQYIGGLVGRLENADLPEPPTTQNCSSSATVNGAAYTGGLVGITLRGVLLNCSATGTVTCLGDCIGGLVGRNDKTTIDTCTYTAGTASGTHSVSGATYIGGLVGYDIDGPIQDSHVTGTGTIFGSKDYIGGLVGYSSGAAIENCYSLVPDIGGGNEVTGVGGNYVGGLVGYANYGTFTGCYASGEITSPVSGSAGGTGGLIGEANGGGDIQKCYSTATVSGNYMVGGLIGRATDRAVSCCYATGSVSGMNDKIGGLIGELAGTASIDDSYAIGVVAVVYEFADQGGLAGANNGTGSISRSYFNNANTGNSLGTATDLASMKIQGTYTDWDFDTIWNIDSGTNNGYPYLR